MDTGLLPRVNPTGSAQGPGGAQLEQLLERRGDDLAGRPLPVLGSASRPAGKSAMRRLVRRGAFGLYRVGRQRVAPTLRRWSRA